jgi:hypothetical protein
MRKLIILLALLYSNTIFAQEKIFQLNKPMNCSSAQALMEYLFKEHGEVPVWVGKESTTGSYISIVMNKEKGTWTVIQYDVATGCVLGSGESGSPI